MTHFSNLISLNKIKIVSPVLGGKEVRARAEVECDITGMEEIAGYRQTVGVDKTSASHHFPYRGCGAGRKILRFGISPLIVDRRADSHVSGADGGNQEMLVEGHTVFVINIFLIVLAEPIGEILGYLSYPFALLISGDGISGATAVVYASESKSGIIGGAPKCGLAETRVTDYGNTLKVSPIYRLKIVVNTAC